MNPLNILATFAPPYIEMNWLASVIRNVMYVLKMLIPTTK